jgi:hypothetical protein
MAHDSANLSVQAFSELDDQSLIHRRPSGPAGRGDITAMFGGTSIILIRICFPL